MGLNIRYNSEIVSVARKKNNGDGKGDTFTLKDRNDTLYHCKIVVIRYTLFIKLLVVLLLFIIFSTGMWVPNIPEQFTGIEHAEVQENPYQIPHDIYHITGIWVSINRSSGFWGTVCTDYWKRYFTYFCLIHCLLNVLQAILVLKRLQI